MEVVLGRGQRATFPSLCVLSLVLPSVIWLWIRLWLWLWLCRRSRLLSVLSSPKE
jgi:hypothetical protein